MTDKYPVLQGKTVLLITGGTGGHVFPAIATAKALQEAGATPVFITNTLPAHLTEHLSPYQHIVIPAASPSGGTFTMLKRALTMLLSIPRSVKAVRKIKPVIAVGYGGYSCFGPLNACIIRNVPFMLHEQNAFAGKANLYFGDKARIIALSFPETLFGKKQETLRDKSAVTGLPVRGEFFTRDANAPVNGDNSNDNGGISLFITGGSQAAAVFAYAVPAAVAGLPEEQRKKLRIVHQCRAEQISYVTEQYKKAGIPAEIAPFFPDIAERMRGADIIIGRAGASTVFEIAASGKASILIPYPFAAGDHQTYNAAYLARRGAAIAVPENKKTLPGDILAALTPLLDDGARRAAAKEAAACAVPNAAEKIVAEAARLAEEREASDAKKKKAKGGITRRARAAAKNR